MNSTNLFDFARIFRVEALAGVEYSFDEIGDRHGTMVAGKPGFIPLVQEFASGLVFAGDWAWAMRRFTEVVRPDAYLLRVDCHYEEILAVTLYCRYPFEPNDELFNETMRCARPFQWSGPSPGVVAAKLHLSGPRGIAFRVDRNAKGKVAVYYKLAAETTSLDQTVLSGLLEACGLPAELAVLINDDIRGLYPRGPVGVLGVDCGHEGVVNALKFNPANVPFRQAFDFLSRKSAPQTRLSELKRIAHSLRAHFVSYLGVKYGPSGFAGWRGYFSVQPSLLLSPLAIPLVVERSAMPTLRLPHY